MSADLVLPLLMRWTHVGTAIVVVGALVFYLLVYVPIAKRVLSEEERERLREPLMRRWKMFIHPPIVLFLISGFYNYIFVTSALHQGQGLYHALFGVKFLLALGIFALLIIMTSTMAWSEKMRKKQGLWSVLLVLGAAIVLLGGFMKVMPQAGGGEDAAESVRSEIVEADGDL